MKKKYITPQTKAHSVHTGQIICTSENVNTGNGFRSGNNDYIGTGSGWGKGWYEGSPD